MTLKRISNSSITNYSKINNLSNDIVRSGLILHYDISNPSCYPGSGTNINDLSGNSLNGTLVGGPTYTSENNGAIVFDGSTQYGTINNNSLLRPSNNFTFSAWIRIDTQQIGWHKIFGGSSYGAGGYLIFLESGGEDYRALVYSSTTEEVRINTISKISVGIWQNITVTFSVGDHMNYYIDGKFVKRRSTPGSSITYGSTSNLYTFMGFESSKFINGRLGDIKIYNRLLSPDEIKQNYDALKTRFRKT